LRGRRHERHQPIIALFHVLGQRRLVGQKHYCSQFLPKYNPNIEADAKKAGVTSWKELFRSRCGDIEIPSRWGNVDKPTL
ncbi:hypothetical protein ACC686_36710, partial [Rhizobium johnstonii]|uniref:hypothetical protein n=1 Tax=Rhizobium johnstonii TaxID=3019933 RepID=UPI003F9A4AFF